jgi:hypothetical protein
MKPTRASRLVRPDGTQILRVATIGDGKVLTRSGSTIVGAGVRVPYYPDTLTVVAGTLAAGAVADVATIGGNNVHIEEVTGAPGFDIIFDFSGVEGVPGQIAIIGYYNGNHAPKIQAYDYVAAGWVTLETILDAGGAQDMHSYALPSSANFVSGGAARVRFYHAQSGATSHDLFVDFVQLLTWG